MNQSVHHLHLYRSLYSNRKEDEFEEGKEEEFEEGEDEFEGEGNEGEIEGGVGNRDIITEEGK